MARKILICNAADVDALAMNLYKSITRGRVIEVEVKREHTSKTLSQLGYLFGVVAKSIQNYEIEQGRYRSIEEIKEWIKLMFYYDEIVVAGEIVRVPRTLTKASKDEMSQVISNAVNWCYDHDIDVPPPPSEKNREI